MGMNNKHPEALPTNDEPIVTAEQLTDTIERIRAAGPRSGAVGPEAFERLADTIERNASAQRDQRLVDPFTPQELEYARKTSQAIQLVAAAIDSARNNVRAAKRSCMEAWQTLSEGNLGTFDCEALGKVALDLERQQSNLQVCVTEFAKFAEARMAGVNWQLKRELERQYGEEQPW
jgi:hypothetical protein